MLNHEEHSSVGLPNGNTLNWYFTLSDSLREPHSFSSEISSSSNGGGSFVQYLPQFAAGLGAEEGGQAVVDLLNRECSRLLDLNPKDFWREGFFQIPYSCF